MRAMALADEFETAQDNVKKLRTKPSDDELLELYSLFKQATQGDVTGSRPGMFDFKGRAKFDAWSKRRGLDKDGAMRKYVDVVSRLTQKYGSA